MIQFQLRLRALTKDTHIFKSLRFGLFIIDKYRKFQSLILFTTEDSQPLCRFALIVGTNPIAEI